MRVAIFSDSLWPRVDGIAVAVRLLALGLIELGHQVLVIGPGECEIPGGQLLRLPSIATPVDGYPFAIIRRTRVEQALNRFRPTLVSVHTIGPTGLLGFTLARRQRVQMLFSWHTDIESYGRTYRVARLLAANSYLSLSLDHPPSVNRRTGTQDNPNHRFTAPTQMRPGSAGLIPASLRQASQRMSAICAPSSGAVDQVRRFGIRRPVFVLPADVTPDDLGVGSAGAQRAVRLIPGVGAAPYLLYVGRLSREKNLGLLLDAFARVEVSAHQRGAPIRLVLVGPAKDARTRALLKRHLAGAIDRAKGSDRQGGSAGTSAHTMGSDPAGRPVRSKCSVREDSSVRPKNPFHLGSSACPEDLSDAVSPSLTVVPDTAVTLGRLEVPDPIVVLGALPRDELGEIYRQAAAFVTPSLSETQCLCVSEAIAVGTPVVVVDPRLAADHDAGAVRVAAPTVAALAEAMTDVLRAPARTRAALPRAEIAESLALRFVAAAEHALTAPVDTVLRWRRDQWVDDSRRRSPGDDGPESYG